VDEIDSQMENTKLFFSFSLAVFWPFWLAGRCEKEEIKKNIQIDLQRTKDD
jgi:hypothetical protein